jgi:hypothetical protein
MNVPFAHDAGGYTKLVDAKGSYTAPVDPKTDRG